MLSDFDSVRQIIELTSPQAELLFRIWSEYYGDEQATSLGLIAEMLNIH
jgi:hypothetical protein